MNKLYVVEETQESGGELISGGVSGIYSTLERAEEAVTIFIKRAQEHEMVIQGVIHIDFTVSEMTLDALG